MWPFLLLELLVGSWRSLTGWECVVMIWIVVQCLDIVV